MEDDDTVILTPDERDKILKDLPEQKPEEEQKSDDETTS